MRMLKIYRTRENIKVNILEIYGGHDIPKKKKKEKEKEKNGFQVNHKSSRCFADRISLEDFPKKIGERDLFMKISRVISDVAVFVERVQ